MFVDAKHEAAVKTLEAAGYTYHGGELWKPRLGPSAKPFLDRIAELEAALRPFGDAYRYTRQMGEFMRNQYVASMTVTKTFTVQDLHRAAELTEPQPKPDSK